MMSCTASAVWSRPISSPCYTEHGQRCGAVLSGRITTVAMSRSGQLSRRLETREPSYAPRAVNPFFIHLSTACRGPWDTW
jgi:hypothetical protein